MFEKTPSMKLLGFSGGCVDTFLQRPSRRPSFRPGKEELSNLARPEKCGRCLSCDVDEDDDDDDDDDGE